MRRLGPSRKLSVADSSATVGQGGPFRYRAEVLDQLWIHGVQPTDRTRPERVHEFVSDLYRYELRRLRDRLVAKAFPKPEYYGRVVDLRKRYPLISLRPDEWLIPPG
jgi:hypothetical protein